MTFTGLRTPHQPPHAEILLKALNLFYGALDASDTGTGKTFVAAWLARELGVTPFVLSPYSVTEDWKEAGRVMGIDVEVINYEKARGVRRKVLTPAPFCEVSRKQFQGPFFVRLAQSQWGFERRAGSGSQWVWRQPYELMVFDEVDRCGGKATLNSKMLIAARRQARYLHCISATAADDPRQLEALGYALRLWTDRKQFIPFLLNHGCKPGIFGGFEWTRDEDEQKQIMLRLHKALFGSGRAARMRKSEIPGFPKTFIDVKLIPDETGKAKRLADDLAEAYENGSRPGHDVALRQALELLMVPILVDLATHYSKSSKVVIFVNFKKTISALRPALKKLFRVETPVIDGENTRAERETIRRAFQANQSPVILCNVQAGGIGIGLHDPTGQVERTTLICPCYSARVLKQIFGRTPRDGGAFSSQFLIGFADTRQAVVARSVLGKLGNLDALNDALLNGVYDSDHPHHHHDSNHTRRSATGVHQSGDGAAKRKAPSHDQSFSS